MIDAEAAYIAIPLYTQREIAQARMDGERLPGVPSGFFWQPKEGEEEQSHGIHNNERGGASMFLHASQRYQHGWDAGKEEV
jgi:hypothetical protein